MCFKKLPAGQFEKNINSPNNSQEASETKEAQPHKVLMSNVLYQADIGVIKDFISAWLSSREGEVKKGCTIHLLEIWNGGGRCCCLISCKTKDDADAIV